MKASLQPDEKVVAVKSWSSPDVYTAEIWTDKGRCYEFRISNGNPKVRKICDLSVGYES